MECITTGPRARARVQLADRDEQRNTVPSVINIGEDSTLCFSDFKVSYQDVKRKVGLDLIKGLIRTFFKGWRGDSQVSVRTGVTVCGLRGTNVMIVYHQKAKSPAIWSRKGSWT
ncbi:MAG: FecR domain-containing protein [Anaerolineales bacterium]|nr:FecR domain-containing protein [Anaerolineales bacterium]